MKRGFRWDKKYLHWGVTAFCVIAAAIVFYMLLRYLPSVGKFFGKLIRIFSPFIWGLVISYLLAPLMKRIDRLFIGRKSKRGRSSIRFARGMAVLVSEIILLIVLAALIYLIIPQLYTSLETIVKNTPAYIDKASAWAAGKLSRPEIETAVNNVLDKISVEVTAFIKNQVLPSLGSLISNVTQGVYVVLLGIYNLIIGIIVSVYILSNLEMCSAGARRLLYSIFSIEAAEKIREGIRFVDKTFMGFIDGKLLDSAIIGLICYIFCALVNMPYALLVSVIVGVTNIIPFFGPFIGAVPTGLIILLDNPLKCLIFIVFIIVLQQVDGNIIGPKILGSSIGINGFWVMFSIILGAGFFGFWGMLLGVPVFVCIYTGAGNLVRRKLKRSDLPTESESYVNLDYIDPATREVFIKKEQD